VKRTALLLLVTAACCVASGCGGSAAAKEPSAAAGRDVARRFAEAIFRGDAATAKALLVGADDTALAGIVTRAAAPWQARHGAIHLPGARSGHDWIFRFDGARTHKDGRFERVRGEIVVVVGASSQGARVELFTFRNERVRFSTHHDAQLLPSNR